MNKPAAIYTRVSSDRQKQDHTIASQTAALIGICEDQRIRGAAGMGLPRRRV